MKYILILLSAGMLSGCYVQTKNQFLDKPIDRISVTLPYTAKTIRVVDLRENVSASGLIVDKMSKRGETEVTPPMDAAHQRVLSDAAKVYFAGGPDREVEIRVHSAYQKLKTQLFSQTEISGSDIEVALIDPIAGKQIASGSGSAESEMLSPSATTEYSEKLYRKMLREGLDKAMTSLSRLTR